MKWVSFMLVTSGDLVMVPIDHIVMLQEGEEGEEDKHGSSLLNLSNGKVLTVHGDFEAVREEIEECAE